MEVNITVIAPDKTQIALRLPKALKKDLTARADNMGVNRNSYIVMVLTEHVKSSPKTGINGERH